MSKTAYHGREFTIKAVVVGIILAVVMAAANAYLGLFAGLTISAGIPGVVLGLGVLKLFKNSTIYENSIIETAASAGGNLAGGVIFTIPALVMMGYWTSFDYLAVAKIASLGGIIGVFFSIPLRRAMIIESDLKFPEGVATALVMQTGFKETHEVDKKGKAVGKTGVGLMIVAAVVTAVFKMMEAGMLMWGATLNGFFAVKNTVIGMGTNLSPALMSVGYIIGLKTSAVIFGGSVLSWLIIIPVLSSVTPHDIIPLDAANYFWSEKIRYIGIGVLIVGGVVTMVSLVKPLISGVKSSLQALKHLNSGIEVERQEKDIPIIWVGVFIVVSVIPLLYYFYFLADSWFALIIIAISLLVFGFIFSSMAAYMAGIIGTSSSPVSSIAITSIVFIAFLMLLIHGPEASAGPVIAIVFGSIICCAAAQAGDNLQDLKAGHIVGTTPWKLQVMQIVGTVAAAFSVGITLNILDSAYTIGSKALSAPQATLMKSVALGVFSGELPWGMIMIGVIIAISLLILNITLKTMKVGEGISILAFGSGVYLPISITSAFFIGGLIAFIAHKRGADPESMHKGQLMASGFIAGESLMGIIVALPIFLSGRTDWWPHISGFSWLGPLLFLFIIIWLYRTSVQKMRRA